MKIYVASSWRNKLQPYVVEALRALGFEVYDFRNPEPENNGFHWSEIDPEWENWGPRGFRAALEHPIARSGFKFDWEAMKAADVCVLLLPCGRSAHIEAGWFVGAGKPLFVLVEEGVEPELMYKMATDICCDIKDLTDRLMVTYFGCFLTANGRRARDGAGGEAMLCNCLETRAEHHVDQIAFFERATLRDGGHTAFALMRCKDCGGFCGFPDSNFRLALREGNDWTHDTLINEGVPKELVRE